MTTELSVVDQRVGRKRRPSELWVMNPSPPLVQPASPSIACALFTSYVYIASDPFVYGARWWFGGRRPVATRPLVFPPISTSVQDGRSMAYASACRTFGSRNAGSLWYSGLCWKEMNCVLPAVVNTLPSPVAS